MAGVHNFIYVFLLVSVAGATETGIVNGQIAKPHSRKYMVSLQHGGMHVCGGLLIREDFILTAAHCLKDRKTDKWMAILGAHDITKKEKSQQRIKVAKWFPHPKYKHDDANPQYDYDIMLFKLKETAKLNKYVELIGLPKENEEVDTTVRCSVAGWGYTEAHGHISNVLKEAEEMLASSFHCNYIWQQYFNCKQMVCTSFSKNQGGVCQGDSGGPLICNTGLVGITAFVNNDDCNNDQYPHVFTKVGFFLKWIEKTMGGK
ncbi:granzyme B-like [Pholidichthys leucotaenia]